MAFLPRPVVAPPATCACFQLQVPSSASPSEVPAGDTPTGPTGDAREPVGALPAPSPRQRPLTGWQWAASLGHGQRGFTADTAGQSRRCRRCYLGQVTCCLWTCTWRGNHRGLYPTAGRAQSAPCRAWILGGGAPSSLPCSRQGARVQKAVNPDPEGPPPEAGGFPGTGAGGGGGATEAALRGGPT